jgi:hypothetical protein
MRRTRFRLSSEPTSPFKSAGASVQSTTGSRVVHVSGSNVGYTMFRGSVKRTCYPLHSPVSPSVPLPCITACHHISTGVYVHYCIQLTLAQISTNLILNYIIQLSYFYTYRLEAVQTLPLIYWAAFRCHIRYWRLLSRPNQGVISDYV